MHVAFSSINVDILKELNLTKKGFLWAQIFLSYSYVFANSDFTSIRYQIHQRRVTLMACHKILFFNLTKVLDPVFSLYQMMTYLNAMKHSFWSLFCLLGVELWYLHHRLC